MPLRHVEGFIDAAVAAHPLKGDLRPDFQYAARI